MNLPVEALAELRERVVGIQKAVESLEADLALLKAALNSKGFEISQLDVTASRLHHDHQGVRQLVMCMLDELDRLVPI